MKCILKWSYTAIMIILMVINATADDETEFSIGYVPICKHFNEGEYNEVNHGVFIFRNQWEIGTFNNSSYIQSYFIGRDLRTNKLEFKNDVYMRLHAHLGLLYGYGESMPNVAGWTIGVTPTFEIGYKSFSIETMVFPVNGGVTALMFKWTW